MSTQDSTIANEMDVNLTSSQLNKESLASFFEIPNFNAALDESKGTFKRKNSHFTSMLSPDGVFDNESRGHTLLTPKSSIGSTISNLTLPSSLHPTISSKVSNNSFQAGSIDAQCRRGNNSFFLRRIHFCKTFSYAKYIERYFLYFSESLLQYSNMNSRFKVSNISQFSHSPIHIGPSIQTAQNSNETINGGEYRIKVLVHDKENLNEINSNLDFIKQRHFSLKKTLEDRFGEITKVHHTKCRRASMPIFNSNEKLSNKFSKLEDNEIKYKTPRFVCKSLFIIALVFVASFSALTIMEVIGIKLSTDIKDVSNRIDNTSSGMLEFQRDMQFFIHEFNKTTLNPTTQKIKPATGTTTTLSTSTDAESTTTIQPGIKFSIQTLIHE